MGVDFAGADFVGADSVGADLFDEPSVTLTSGRRDLAGVGVFTIASGQALG